MHAETLSRIITQLRDIADLLERCPPEDEDAPERRPHLCPLPFTDYLAERGLRLIDSRQPDPTDAGLTPLAQHIASTHPRCEPLIRAITSSGTRGDATTVRLALRDRPPEHIAALTSLGAHAARLQLLPGYRYHRTPACVITTRLPRSPHAIDFFGGRWLDLVVADAARRCLPPRGWSLGLDLTLGLPRGEPVPVNALATSRGRPPLLVIASTATELADALPVYRRLVDALDLPASRALLLTPNLDPEAQGMAAAQAGMSPLSLQELPRTMTVAMSGPP